MFGLLRRFARWIEPDFQPRQHEDCVHEYESDDMRDMVTGEHVCTLLRCTKCHEKWVIPA